jgi:predicted SnoaL-like aldol condensation-catalyzing enzyme
MNAALAAARWAATWSQAWARRDAEAIAALYSDGVVYRSPAFREPYLGLAGVRRYLSEQLPAEQNIQCWFGEPIASGDRAAVEWWASWTEHGQELTFAGVTVLRFDEEGNVVEHRDYDNHVEGRESPYAEWSSA